MSEQVVNAVETTLAGAIGSGDTTLTVASAAGLPTSATFRLRLGPLAAPLSACELVLVTHVAGAVYTVQRGAEGTTAQAWGVGTVIVHVLTAAALDALLGELGDSIDAVQSGSVARDEEIEADAEALAADLSAETSARTAADGTEATARANAVGAEATARANADATEASTRAAADTANATAAAAAQTTANAALPRTGGSMTGALVLVGDAAGNLQPVTRQQLESAIESAIDALVDGAPIALDTLKELATAIEGDETGLSALTAVVDGKLAKASNLSDVANATTARVNLGAAAQAALEAEEAARKAADTAEETRAKAAEALKLAKASNLSDLADAPTARGNLGLGTAATQASGAFDAAGAAAAAQGAAEGFATTADGLLVPKSYLDPDGTMAANSDSKVATQKATKTLVATKADLIHASRHQLGGADALALPQYDPYDLLPGVLPEYPTTTLTWTAKRVYLLRFTVSRKREFKFLRFPVTVTGSEDKVDVGIYKWTGTKFERMKANGGVKMSAFSGVKAVEMSGTVVCEPGVVYYRAIVWEAVTGSPIVGAILNNSSTYGDIFGTASAGNRLYLFKEAVWPLPEEITAASLGGGTVVPWVVPSES